jgi:hypothetical protein
VAITYFARSDDEAGVPSMAIKRHDLGHELHQCPVVTEPLRNLTNRPRFELTGRLTSFGYTYSMFSDVKRHDSNRMRCWIFESK